MVCVAVTLYEFAGGDKALLALADAHHANCLADELLNHPFSHGTKADHVERLAAYWGEVLGGPPRYSEQFGNETAVLYIHSATGAPDEMGERFADCFTRALDQAGFPADETFRAALDAYMRWAVGQVMAISPEGSTVAEALPIPRWGWDGLETPG
jgi:hemoglobin